MFELPPKSGHGRVWTRTLEQLDQMAVLASGRVDPDVWLVDGHDGDPGCAGPLISVVYEVGWGKPDLDIDHTPEFVERISSGTRDAVLRSDYVLTPAHSSKQGVIETYRIPADRVYVVPFGVDSSVFRPDAPRVGQLPFDPEDATEPYILFASTLHPRKNLASVRDAVLGLARRGFGHRLVIVGEPFGIREDNQEIQERAFAELPGFPGRIVRVVDPSDEDLAHLMANAAALCQPSKHEGFGLTVLEAMACGTPVVVSNRGSLPELVKGVGWIVEPTSQAVEAALVDILTHPSKVARARTRGRRRGVRLSWEKTARGWLRVAQMAASTAPDQLINPAAG